MALNVRTDMIPMLIYRAVHKIETDRIRKIRESYRDKIA
jgi:hypothetical protein